MPGVTGFPDAGGFNSVRSSPSGREWDCLPRRRPSEVLVLPGRRLQVLLSLRGRTSRLLKEFYLRQTGKERLKFKGLESRL